MLEESELAAEQASEFFHHRHHEREEKIRVQAYLNWINSGRPLFVASITFANWIDAELQLECPGTTAPSGPGHGTE